MIKHKNSSKKNYGYKLIANPYLIKLEKIPGIPQGYMGVPDFTDKIEYVFLCLILIFLETKSRKDQFILSGLIDYIQNLQVDIEMSDITIDFNLYSQRKSMVKVLKFIRELGFIKIYDGDENKFSESVESDVLYEVTGVSKYFVRNFTSNISDCNLYTDIYEKERLGLDQDKGIERRQRIYRRLFTENVVYNEGAEDLDYLYIKNYKGAIEQDVDKMLDASFAVHKNGAYILLLDNNNFKNTFPNNRAISDIVLFINAEIIEKFETDDLKKQVNDTIYISELEFRKIVEQVKEKYGVGFSKEYREKEIDKILEEVIDFMMQFDLLRKHPDTKEFILMPMIFKMKGKYPADFRKVD